MGLKAINLFFKGIVLIFSLAMLIASIIGLLSSNVNPVQNFYIPFAGLALPVILFIDICLIVFWLFNKSWLTVIPLLAIVINYQFILSMVHVDLFPEKDYGTGDSKIKIATYNIHGFNYLQDDLPVNAISEYMSGKNVDILCMQEFASPAVLNMEETIKAFGYFPYSTIHESSVSESGLAIFSKFIIKEYGNIHFASTSNGAIWADLELKDGKIIRVLNVHLQTTGVSRSNNLSISKQIEILGQNFQARAVQADIIRTFIDSSKTPVILCGDFNDTPSSYTYKTAKSNLVDGFKETGSGFGSTFRGKLNLLRIDYIMYSNDLQGINYYSNQCKWSDHNPVLAELDYRR